MTHRFISIYLHVLSRQEKNGSFNSQNVFRYTAIFSVRFPTRRRLCMCLISQMDELCVDVFHPMWDDLGDNDDLSLISRFHRNESCFQKYTFGGGGTNEIFCLAFQWDYERFLRVMCTFDSLKTISDRWTDFLSILSTPWLPQQYLVNRSEEAQ